MAQADEVYPAWLWSVDSSSTDIGIGSSHPVSGDIAGGLTMSKGEARAAQKRSVKAARAQQRRGVDAASTDPQAANIGPKVDRQRVTVHLNQSAAAFDNGAQAAEVARLETRRSLRRANRNAIKARNFVVSS